MEMNSYFGSENRVLPHLRQNLRDASHDSVPLLQKKTRSAKEFSTNSFASLVEGTVW